MKKLIRFSSFACALGVVTISAQNILFPLVYRIKEPLFAMPIELKRSVNSSKALPIRNDGQGDGAFAAKRSGNRIHLGLDLASEIDSPVYASKSGWAKARNVPGGYGKLIIIDHPGEYETRYGHLSQFAIKKSQWVRQGDTIGAVGKTGNADSSEMVPHLHFEIRRDNEPVDPAALLIKQEG